MASQEHRRNRLGLWYETTRWPGLVLVGLVILLYGRSLGWGFLLDDHRQQRLLKEYDEGRRDSLDLYHFLVSDEGNRQAREAGWYPWWMGDDLRFRHWRPVSERFLYAQYKVFGDGPLGYRLVGLALYAGGVCLVLALFRCISGDERLARWAALVFAMMASHAVPVVFVSAQSDVLALVLAGGAMLLAARFVGSGGGVCRLIVSAALYALSLGSKEACLPMAVLPLCFALALRSRPGAWRRALGSSAMLSAVGLVWFVFYVQGEYGANSLLMLDPVHAPWDYLAALPGRALALLSSLVIPLNPFVFYLRPRGTPWLYVYCAAGTIGLILILCATLRRGRRSRGVVPMALWVVPFIPLLACTVPDDRVMVLPGIGFAFLIGAWMTGARGGEPIRLRRIPILLFLVVQACGVLGVTQVMRFIETDTKEAMGAAIAGFERELAPGDCVFFLNATRDWRVLFAQLGLESVSDVPDVSVGFLSDAENPAVTRVGRNTVRIRAEDEGLFTGFLGAMAVSRDRPKQVGDAFRAGAFAGRITAMSGDVVREVEIDFDKPLEADCYRFYGLNRSGEPARWFPPPLGD